MVKKQDKINNLFSIRDIDAHYVVFLFGKVLFKVRHKVKNYDKRSATDFGLNTLKRQPKIIVSLTSFPGRIQRVHCTIENLLTQTIKPDKLILWLNEKEFPNKEKDLPESLLRLKNFGLSIEWCEYMRSYQKLVPAMQKYPDDIIITFDDDFYYTDDMIEDLLVSYLKAPEYIHANRTWRGEFKSNRFVLSSTNKMFENTYSEPSFKNLLMGYGAVLYPPNSLSPIFKDKEIFMELIPTHDDVWLWAMSVLGRTKTKTVNGYNLSIVSVEDTQQVALRNINSRGNSEGMDTEDAYNKIISKYPEIRAIIESEEGGQ